MAIKLELEESIVESTDATTLEDQDFLNFLKAASEGNLDFLRDFTTRRISDINKIDDTYCAAATHFAAKHNQLEALRFLISEGAVLGRLTNQNLNELHYGVRHVEIIKLIIEHQPELINSIGKNNCTALHRSIFFGADDSAEYFLEQESIKVDYEAFELAKNKNGFAKIRDEIRHKLVTITPREEFENSASNQAEEIISAAENISKPMSSPSKPHFRPIQEEFIGKIERF